MFGLKNTCVVSKKKWNFSNDFTKNNFFRFADEVSIGMEVLVNNINTLVPTKVINISSFMMQGNYQMQTTCFSSSWNTLRFSMTSTLHTANNLCIINFYLRNHCINLNINIEISICVCQCFRTFLLLFQVYMYHWQWKLTLWLMECLFPAMLLIIMIWLILLWHLLIGFLTLQSRYLGKKKAFQFMS